MPLRSFPDVGKTKNEKTRSLIINHLIKPIGCKINIIAIAIA